MPDTSQKAQAPRNATATIALTEGEKRAIRGVAAAREITESDLLRDNTIAEIVRQFERIRAVPLDP